MRDTVDLPTADVFDRAERKLFPIFNACLFVEEGRAAALVGTVIAMLSLGKPWTTMRGRGGVGISGGSDELGG